MSVLLPSVADVPCPFQETKGRSLEEVDLMFAKDNIHNLQDAKDSYTHNENAGGKEAYDSKEEISMRA